MQQQQFNREQRRKVYDVTPRTYVRTTDRLASCVRVSGKRLEPRATLYIHTHQPSYTHYLRLIVAYINYRYLLIICCHLPIRLYHIRTRCSRGCLRVLLIVQFSAFAPPKCTPTSYDWLACGFGPIFTLDQRLSVPTNLCNNQQNSQTEATHNVRWLYLGFIESSSFSLF